MCADRKIRGVIRSQPTIEGAGVRLKRVFGQGDENLFDPFLLMDDFRADHPHDFEPGFPWHPHRGIETITYVLRGEIAHSDSLGHAGVIGAGDVQWMTAGNGIIHQEMPQGDIVGFLAGFQLWANLPARQKMIEPRYRDVSQAKIPKVTLDGGVTVRIIAGEVQGVRGPVNDIVIAPAYLDFSLPAHTEVIQALPPGHTAFVYVIGGRMGFVRGQHAASLTQTGTACDPPHNALVADTHLVLFGDGDQVVLRTDHEPARCLLIAGQPLHEPIAWLGPVVMNTQEELQRAFQEYHQGTFLAHRAT